MDHLAPWLAQLDKEELGKLGWILTQEYDGKTEDGFSIRRA